VHSDWREHAAIVLAQVNLIWGLEQRYQAPLLWATTRDLREYRLELAHRQKPASVNAALAALRRFYAWAATRTW
jgi:hypothetical protein